MAPHVPPFAGFHPPAHPQALVVAVVAYEGFTAVPAVPFVHAHVEPDAQAAHHRFVPQVQAAKAAAAVHHVHPLAFPQLFQLYIIFHVPLQVHLTYTA